MSIKVVLLFFLLYFLTTLTLASLTIKLRKASRLVLTFVKLLEHYIEIGDLR